MCTGFDKDGFDSTAATATRVVAYNIAEVDTDATFFWGGEGEVLGAVLQQKLVRVFRP